MSEDGLAAGLVAIEDPLRPEAASVVETMMGLKRSRQAS